MLGIRKSAKGIPRKPQDSLRSDSEFFRGMPLADSQMPSMTKTPVDVYKYIYVSELVLAVI